MSQHSPNIFCFLYWSLSNSWAPLCVQSDLPSPRAAQLTDGSHKSSAGSATCSRATALLLQCSAVGAEGDAIAKHHSQKAVALL